MRPSILAYRRRYARAMFTARAGRAILLARTQSCTERGLHSALRYRSAGELLPPLSILADLSAVCFCCTILGVASTGRYPAFCSAVPGLSSRLSPRGRTANSEYIINYTSPRGCLSIYYTKILQLFLRKFACHSPKKVIQCIREKFDIYRHQTE